MNFSEVFQTLNQASAFDLFRLRAAIDRALDEPRWLQAIQSRLKVGQAVQYFDLRANTLKRAQVLEMRRKEVVVLDLEDAVRWVLSYAAINLDGADVQIREQKPQGLGRNEVALQCDHTQWRVAYSFLHRVVDVDGMLQGAAAVNEDWQQPHNIF
jgi:hypothetical protein